MAPDQIIAGRYMLHEQIGAGGMATVWRARDSRLERDVAVKLIRTDLGDNREFAARFADEARRMARFSHPNIVSVHDYGLDAGLQFIVMELIRGRNLAQVIRQQGRLNPKRAAEIARDVAAALQAAHRYGVVHRDVKPANILITTDGHVKLADLGIAQAADDAGHTTTGQTLGSVDYFSPEQARGEAAGPQTDVYALGVVLYEMLTGRRPFGGESPAAIAISRLTAPPPDPRSAEPDLPHSLVLICMRALALDPHRRYRSARGLRTALTRWLGTAAEDATTPQPAAVMVPMPVAVAPPSAVRPHPMIPKGQAAVPLARPPSDRPRSRPAWPVLAALLLMLVVAGFAGQRFVSNLAEAQRSAPAVGAVASATPESTEEPTPSQEPPTPRATPTERERATPEPTPLPATPQPTAAPTSPPPPTASPAQVASTDLSAPEAVTRFYSFVTNGRFDAAYALWSDRMKATYPRQENLDRRFDDTAAIRIHGLEMVSQDGGRAVVAIDFTETYEGGATRRFRGSWELVRAGDRWLLDAPHF